MVMDRQRQRSSSVVDAQVSAYMELVTARQDLMLGQCGAAFSESVAAASSTLESFWPRVDDSESDGNYGADALPPLRPWDFGLLPSNNTPPVEWPPRYRRLCCEAAAMTILRMKKGSESLAEYVANTASIEMLRCIRETQAVLRAAFGMDRVDDSHKRRIAAVLDADHATVQKRSRLTGEKKDLEKIKATIEARFGRSGGGDWGDF